MATEHLAVAPIVIPLVTAAGALMSRRWPRIHIAVSLLGILTYAVAVGLLAWLVVLAPTAPGAAAYQLGGWPAPFGITLVADALAVFVLGLTAAVALPALLFSVPYLDSADQQIFYHPLFHFLLAGISGAFLTGDLFNLFVWFEVILMASYVLIAFYGGPKHTRATLWFLVLNIVGSALMLLAIGGLYATTGTLNFADMARRLADPVAYGVAVGPVVGLSGLLFTVFALKAGLVPFQFWVPSAYTAAPLPVTALLAGATKKVGVYAIIRLYYTVFSSTDVAVTVPWVGSESILGFIGLALLVMAVASIAVGGIGAVQAASLEEIFAYSSIGQVGFIVMPLAIGAMVSDPTIHHLAVLTSLVFALHHALTKSMLFLIAGTVRNATGVNQLADLNGLAGQFPAIGGAFLVGCLSLIGIPPLSGFVGKLLVFDVAVRLNAYIAGIALLIGSLLTIAYTTRAWTASFWGEQSPPVAAGQSNHYQVAVILLLAAMVIAIGIGFEPIARFADAAATAATDTDAYIDLVAPSGGVDS